jgi:hypothetical protein
MFNGKWWLSPSVIKNWSDEKVKFIEYDFWCYHERQPFEPYDVSLFDDLRLEFCKDLPSNRQDIELRKINAFPEREPIEERKIRFRDLWLKFRRSTT